MAYLILIRQFEIYQYISLLDDVFSGTSLYLTMCNINYLTYVVNDQVYNVTNFIAVLTEIFEDPCFRSYTSKKMAALDKNNLETRVP